MAVYIDQIQTPHIPENLQTAASDGFANLFFWLLFATLVVGVISLFYNRPKSKDTLQADKNTLPDSSKKAG